jgi:hypothetical protein
LQAEQVEPVIVAQREVVPDQRRDLAIGFEGAPPMLVSRAE